MRYFNLGLVLFITLTTGASMAQIAEARRKYLAHQYTITQLAPIRVDDLKTYAYAINSNNEVVGTTQDSSYNGASAILWDAQGVAQYILNEPDSCSFPYANAINDNGTIVGSYSNFLPDNAWWHGFIYNNGKWATLDFPGKQTQLSGVSNSNLIVGNTVAGRGSITETGAFMYQNGTFKRIQLPNNVPTSVRGTSANKSLITGSSGSIGFIATCK